MSGIVVAFLVVVLGWLATFGLLAVSGIALSQSMLDMMNSAQFVKKQQISGSERLIRRVYRMVINVAGVFYFVSVHGLAIFIIAALFPAFVAFGMAGTVPFDPGVFIFAAIGYAMVEIMVQFGGEPSEPVLPGRPVTREEAPDLWDMVEAVAERLGTRPVDTIFIKPDTAIAVTEEGNLIQKWLNMGERRLILGLGVLSGVTQNQFQAILAHEYGHFSNRDTAGGTLAGYVVDSMYHAVRGFRRTGSKRWYNPVWMFMRVFKPVFLRIALGASRLQELMADRCAAQAYGPEHLSSGLAAVIRQEAVFTAHVKYAMARARFERSRIDNLWTLPPIESRDQWNPEKFERELAETMARTTDEFDSHPSPNERIEYIKHVMPSEPVIELPDSAADLLGNLPTLQVEMTNVINDRLAMERSLRRDYRL